MDIEIQKKRADYHFMTIPLCSNSFFCPMNEIRSEIRAIRASVRPRQIMAPQPPLLALLDRVLDTVATASRLFNRVAGLLDTLNSLASQVRDVLSIGDAEVPPPVVAGFPDLGDKLAAKMIERLDLLALELRTLVLGAVEARGAVVNGDALDAGDSDDEAGIAPSETSTRSSRTIKKKTGPRGPPSDIPALLRVLASQRTQLAHLASQPRALNPPDPPEIFGIPPLKAADWISGIVSRLGADLERRRNLVRCLDFSLREASDKGIPIEDLIDIWDSEEMEAVEEIVREAKERMVLAKAARESDLMP